MSVFQRRSHVFVDESKARGYFVAAATVTSERASQLDRDVRKLRRRGQSRIHFSSESDSSRRLLVMADRRIIREALVANDYLDELTYQHASPADHSVLWISDAVAWCHQAGGEWIVRAKSMVGGIATLS